MVRGRPESPKNQERVKTALLEAANSLLKNKSFREISVREIAIRAGQSSAMISYYFGSKERLFIELLEREITPQASKLLENLTKSVKDNHVDTLRSLMKQFISMHKKSPWLSRFLVDNVILKSGKLRQMFVSRVIGVNAEKIIELLTAMKEQNKIHKDFDLDLIRISFMSLMAFPFLAAPILKEALNFDTYHVNVDEWVEHTLSIFLTGISPNEFYEH